MKTLTLKQLHAKLGEVLNVCPKLANNVVSVTSINDRVDRPLIGGDINSVIIRTDGDDFYVAIMYYD